jgi:hypothetical protein
VRKVGRYYSEDFCLFFLQIRTHIIILDPDPQHLQYFKGQLKIEKRRGNYVPDPDAGFLLNPSVENIHLNASGIFFRILQALEEVSSPQHPATVLD